MSSQSPHCQRRSLRTSSKCSLSFDRGIDLTIKDYRWEVTAEGWPSVAAKDDKMAQWLPEAQQRLDQASH